MVAARREHQARPVHLIAILGIAVFTSEPRSPAPTYRGWPTRTGLSDS